ncbi:hypothetical protein Tsubulata_007651 [Turnera subulata]|uniref:Uncharacterized protein n=1 Tax=Turnera subulata TaxID=218843 RepID=A0A9Q0G2U9_9ROSI|nr:hypothetical protein Tsubulata_007651 [Turnera subulata]
MAGGMEANKNRFIEDWSSARENLEYNFRWTRRNLALVGLFGIAIPIFVYKGIVKEFGFDVDLCGGFFDFGGWVGQFEVKFLSDGGDGIVNLWCIPLLMLLRHGTRIRQQIPKKQDPYASGRTGLDIALKFELSQPATGKTHSVKCLMVHAELYFAYDKHCQLS